MAKNATSDWDTTATNNADVGGINIAENCPAANINDAIREVMAQIAAGIDGIEIGQNVPADGTFLGISTTGTATLGAVTVNNGIITVDRTGDASPAYVVTTADAAQRSGFRITDTSATTRDAIVSDGANGVIIGAAGWATQTLQGSWSVQTNLAIGGTLSVTGTGTFTGGVFANGGLTVEGNTNLGGGSFSLDRIGDAANALLLLSADGGQIAGVRAADTTAAQRNLVSTDGADIVTVGSAGWLAQRLDGNWLANGSLGAASLAGAWRATPLDARNMTSHERIITPDRLVDAFGVVIIAYGNLDGTGTPSWNYQGGFSASIIDNGTGHYTVAFDSAEADTQYTVSAVVESTSAAVLVNYGSRTANGFDIFVRNLSGTLINSDNINLTVIRRPQ